MGILAVYDIIGIQNYIFASNKLAENVGGSRLIADVFDFMLPDAIKEITGTPPPGSDWRCGKALNPALKAEIIYQGGGNAFVAFADETPFQKVTKAFLVRVSKRAPGIGIATAAIETDFTDYKDDFDKLGKRLAIVKGGFNTPVFAGNQPITKQSRRTGDPASVFQDDEYLSLAQFKKRERYTEHKEKHPSGIKNFSDLSFDKGSDSLIAIIHADGNSMGSKIKDYMQAFEKYEEAVPEIRALSVRINECYKAARDKTINAFGEKYADYLKMQTAKGLPVPQGKDGKPFTEPPILELIGDGDDTTLVTGGRFALDIAACLLREIEKTPQDKRPFEASIPTACAGVVLFHNHYPFSEGYKLVEELCSSAKKPSRDADGSYIDFHLHQSGSVASLSELRKRQYTVDGKTLLQRPWMVNGSCSDVPDFGWFEKNAKSLKCTRDFPRNKTKALRNAIGAGDVAADIAISQMRGKKPPKPPVDPTPKNMSRYAAYFDILEFYDVYERLLNKEGAVNDEI